MSGISLYSKSFCTTVAVGTSLGTGVSLMTALAGGAITALAAFGMFGAYASTGCILSFAGGGGAIVIGGGATIGLISLAITSCCLYPKSK